MNPTIESILAQIKTLSFDEQRMLNKALVGQLNATQKLKAASVAISFRIGDIVEFDAGFRKGGITKVQIEGFSRDLSSIKGFQVGGLRQGTKWTVGANLCKKVA